MVVRVLSTLLLLSGLASAQDPVHTWTIALRGKKVGVETVRVSVQGEQRVYRAKGELKVTDKPFPFTHTLTVSAKDYGLVGYALDSTIVRAGAKPLAAGVELTTDYGPKNVGKKTVSGPRPYVVIDTLTYSHYDVLGRFAAARTGTKPFTFLALNPQGARATEATFAPSSKTFRIAIHGTPRQVRRGTLTAGKLKAILVYDAQDGQAYRVEDSQGFTAVRDGWPAAPWKEEQVSVPGLARGTPPVSGTLTTPRDAQKSPPPVVLFLTDSGPQDRDETIGPNKPFRDLARGLASRGVASLRCDKRSFALKQLLSGGDPKLRAAARKRWAQITFDTEYVDDAVSGLRWLRQRKDLGQVYLLGHGLGARGAIAAAPKFPRLSGLILLGAGGRTRDVLIREESIYQMTREGKKTRESPEVKEVEAKIKQAFAAIKAGKFANHLNAMGYPVGYWRDLLSRAAPPKALEAVTAPVLLLHAEADYQVGKVDVELLQAALATRKNAGHQVKRFEKLNHLFMPVEGKSDGREYTKPGRLAKVVPTAIAAWIAGRSKERKK